jgi:Zn-finger nucleic acid-binding protein
MVNCPACRSELETAVYHEVEVDRCTSCVGVWLDHREVDELFALPELPEKLLAECGEKPLVSVPEGSRTCPRCKEFLFLVNVDQVPLDVCGECHGLFLDCGEFARLARAAEERHRVAEEPDLEAAEDMTEMMSDPVSEEPSGGKANRESWKDAISLAANRLTRWYESRR